VEGDFPDTSLQGDVQVDGTGDEMSDCTVYM